MHSRNSIRWDLDHALAQSGCSICHLTQKGITRFLDGLLYENVNDPEIRHHVTQALGFCNRHAWQIRSMHASALGMAMLNRDALNQWQRQLASPHKPSGRESEKQFRKQIAHANHAREKCLACQRQNEIEQRYVETLIEALPEPDFAERFHQSAGLCRPHFAQVCDAATRVETLETLREFQMEINNRLVAELDELIRKNDYRFISEGLGAEGDAWIRAIARLGGAEGTRC